MPSLRIQFGRKLRRLRLAGDVTQERFAEEIGISATFLGLIERGVNAPSFETIDQIARVLKLPVSELFVFDTKSKLEKLGERARATRRPLRR
jgi:transcriptional regulator with XRE-family HTH domain